MAGSQSGSIENKLIELTPGDARALAMIAQYRDQLVRPEHSGREDVLLNGIEKPEARAVGYTILRLPIPESERASLTHDQLARIPEAAAGILDWAAQNADYVRDSTTLQ